MSGVINIMDLSMQSHIKYVQYKGKSVCNLPYKIYSRGRPCIVCTYVPMYSTVVFLVRDWVTTTLWLVIKNGLYYIYIKYVYTTSQYVSELEVLV